MRSFNHVCVCLIVAAATLPTIGCEPVCGDNLCEQGEEWCVQDCGYCGDGNCYAREENFANCPVDCYDDLPVCDRDGRCDTGEDNANCPNDCPPTWDCFCGDGYCDLTCENTSTCYDDCGWCGDSVCSGPEDVWNCDRDCAGYCGDGYCEAGEEGWCEDCWSQWDCGGGTYACSPDSFANCCYSNFYTCPSGYPYYCPANTLCYAYMSEWQNYCWDWAACTYAGWDC